MKNFCEIIGTLQEIDAAGEDCKLVFNVRKEVSVPLNVIDLDKLEAYIGHRIGIVNIDGNFYFRLMKN